MIDTDTDTDSSDGPTADRLPRNGRLMRAIAGEEIDDPTPTEAFVVAQVALSEAEALEADLAGAEAALDELKAEVAAAAERLDELDVPGGGDT